LEKDANYYYNKATVYTDEGKHSLAIDNFKKALELEPDSIEFMFNLGIAYINKKEYDSAIGCFHEVLKRSPNEIAAFSNLALAYTRKQENEPAIKYYKKVMELSPEDTSTYKDLADVYVKNRQYDEAIECYEKFIKANPSSVIAKESLKTAINLKNNAASSPQPVSNKPVDALPINEASTPTESADDLFVAAVNYVKLQNIDAGIENLRKCLKINPNYPKAGDLLDKLFKLKAMGKNIEVQAPVVPVVKMPVATVSGFVDYRKYNEALSLGVAYFNVKNYSMAMEQFNKCVEIDPTECTAKKYISDIKSKM
jgi:tetratricopeptide (TPR) repeat protein